MTTLEKVLKLIENSGVKDFPLEKAVGLSQGSIKHWRKQDAPTPSAEAITKLAQYFNVSADYLLGLTDDPQQKSSPTVAGEPDKLAKILSDYMVAHDLQIKDENELKIALDTFAAVMQSLQKNKE